MSIDCKTWMFDPGILPIIDVYKTRFRQINAGKATYNHEPIDSLIKGDWHLTQIDIIDDYSITSTTNRFNLQASQNKKITFTSDSIYSHRDSTIPYYISLKNYSYKIQYDSIVRENFLKLYSGKKRKLHEVESYEIIKCTLDELIVRRFQLLNTGMGYSSFSIVYTYRKEGVSDALNEITGEWFDCSNQKNLFMTEKNSLAYEFVRGSNDSIFQNSGNCIDLVFNQANYENEIYFAFSYGYSGIRINSIFNIDPKEKLIYLLSTDKSLVYSYKVVNNEKLILSLDRDRTQKLNSQNTR